MSCPASGDCVAAGDYYNGALPGFVITQQNGVWGTARPISGLSPLTGGSGVTVYSISCASPGNCAVAGTVSAPYPTSSSKSLLRGFVVGETNGTWGTADILPPPVNAAKLGPGQMLSVSCSAPGDCLAGGYDFTDYQTTMAEVVEETDGAWGAPVLIPGAPALDGVKSVSCTAPGECVAGLGSARKGYAAALATESGGTWSVRAVPGLSALASGQLYSAADSVSCPSAGDCTVAGEFATVSDSGRLFAVTERNGTWGQARELPGRPSFAPIGIVPSQLPLSCAAPGDCALAADDIIADQVNGVWDGPVYLAPRPVAGDTTLTALSCWSPGNCSAGGFVQHSSSSMYAFVVDEVNGTWGRQVRVAGTKAIDVAALSCAAADSCVAGGTGGTGGFFTEKVPVARTATVIRLSARRVPFGHERAEKVAVTVSADSGTPTGTVILRSGGAKVCVIHLALGHGSCRPRATRFRVGEVRLVAYYRGPAWYAVSASSAVFLRVIKAGTRTRLNLSARTIRYRHEHRERLVARVRPRYAGTAAGTVIVTAGRATVCVIRLHGEAGECRLRASRLRPGVYHLIARYHGARNFARSASPALRLRVRR